MQCTVVRMEHAFESHSPTMVRYRGEEMWIGDEHIANIRLSSEGLAPVVVQRLDGTVCFGAVDRRRAELWVRVHAPELRTPQLPSPR